MNMRASRSTPASLLLVLALIASACRGSSQQIEETGDRRTGIGVTEEACPQAVNPDNGCIFLGTISDLTEGPFAALGVPVTEGQRAFWRRVNEEGGIGGYDIDVTTFVRDNKYNPQIHNQVWQEIKGDVLGLAQTLGSPTTAAIMNDLAAGDVVSVPASFSSEWLYQDVMLESGANYCIESMNAVDFAVEERDVASVMAVHFDGDYGDDGAAGVKIAAEAHDLRFTSVEYTPRARGGTPTAAVEAIIQQQPDLVILTLSPVDTVDVVGAAAQRGYRGLFIGTSPTWDPKLLQTQAAQALKDLYLQSSPIGAWPSDTPGHQAMREALGNVRPSEGYSNGWAWSYPMKAALQKAVENGDLTRQGLLAAVKQLDKVDYQGMLPAGAGNYAGEPNEMAVRQSIIHRPDDAAPTGLTQVRGFFAGPTAQRFRFGNAPCFAQQQV
jgi:ABC-type branched-subunit amino acid transport system substrate-binding protein